MVTMSRNGKVSQKEVDAQDMIEVYHNLLDEDYRLVRKGE
jgi:hypothetical protein